MTALAKTATPAATKLDEGQKLRPRYLESLNLVERLHRQLLDVIKDELDRANRGGWQERLEQALVKLPPTPLVRAKHDQEPKVS